MVNNHPRLFLGGGILKTSLKKIKMKKYIKQLLSDYINDCSDNSPMEAIEQDEFVKGWERFIHNQQIEQEIIERIMDMADKSLSPIRHSYLMIAIKELCENSKSLIVTNSIESEYEKAKNHLIDTIMPTLASIAKDSGASVHRDDAALILDLEYP